MNEKNAHKKFKLSELAQVFTQDLEAARKGIIRSKLRTNQKLHWLLNIGEYSMVERQIGDPSIDVPEKAKGWVKVQNCNSTKEVKIHTRMQ